MVETFNINVLKANAISKRDIWLVLSYDCELVLPKPDQCTMVYLKQIATGAIKVSLDVTDNVL